MLGSTTDLPILTTEHLLAYLLYVISCKTNKQFLENLTVNNLQQFHLNLSCHTFSYMTISYYCSQSRCSPYLFNSSHYKTLRRAERDTDMLTGCFA